MKTTVTFTFCQIWWRVRLHRAARLRVEAAPKGSSISQHARLGGQGAGRRLANALLQCRRRELVGVGVDELAEADHVRSRNPRRPALRLVAGRPPSPRGRNMTFSADGEPVETACSPGTPCPGRRRGRGASVPSTRRIWPEVGEVEAGEACGRRGRLPAKPEGADDADETSRRCTFEADAAATPPPSAAVGRLEALVQVADLQHDGPFIDPAESGRRLSGVCLAVVRAVSRDRGHRSTSSPALPP